MLPKVKVLVQKYDKGPFSNPKVGNRSYLSYLNEDLAKNINDLSAMLDAYNREYNKWVSSKDYCKKRLAG